MMMAAQQFAHRRRKRLFNILTYNWYALTIEQPLLPSCLLLRDHQ